MIPVFMTVKHDPPNSWGDCYRASIASILELPAEEVPHAGCRGFDNWHEEHAKLDAWLASRGLYMFAFKIDADKLYQWEDALGYHLLSGRSPRGPHTCVGLGGKLVHNPNPLNDGLEPDEDGTYALSFLCMGPR